MKDVAHDFSNIKDQIKINQKRNLPERSPESERDELNDESVKNGNQDTEMDVDVNIKENSDKPSEEDKIISDEMLTEIITNPKKESYWCVLYRLDGSFEVNTILIICIIRES